MSRVGAVIFDVYKTLLDNRTDEESLDSYAFLARWLAYHGVETDAPSLRGRYLELCTRESEEAGTLYPDFDISRVFASILLDGEATSFDVEAKSREMALLFRVLTTKWLAAYPGVHQLLTGLQGKVKLGIVSNAQAIFTDPELERFSLLHYFDSVVYSSAAGVRKPDPGIFLKGLHALGVQPEAAVYVGDNLFDDVYGAGAVGMKTIWLRRDGAQRDCDVRAAQMRPDYVVEEGSYQVLSEVLQSML
ncbi:HAD family hydrolase [Geomonas sp.]|uniref:HAD family hydrolase n=1 Tax=Geomonas sp. TaxID=2651584 RepID=UPI002B4A94F6|nr:HAD family hydrolase [Geomonas sp.]HJV36901.1 HAD family hydrolase [Geomonas sp.]